MNLNIVFNNMVIRVLTYNNLFIIFHTKFENIDEGVKRCTLCVCLCFCICIYVCAPFHRKDFISKKKRNSRK